MRSLSLSIQKETDRIQAIRSTILVQTARVDGIRNLCKEVQSTCFSNGKADITRYSVINKLLLSSDAIILNEALDFLTFCEKYLGGFYPHPEMEEKRREIHSLGTILWAGGEKSRARAKHKEAKLSDKEFTAKFFGPNSVSPSSNKCHQLCENDLSLAELDTDEKSMIKGIIYGVDVEGMNKYQEPEARNYAKGTHEMGSYVPAKRFPDVLPSEDDDDVVKASGMELNFSLWAHQLLLGALRKETNDKYQMEKFLDESDAHEVSERKKYQQQAVA